MRNPFFDDEFRCGGSHPHHPGHHPHRHAGRSHGGGLGHGGFGHGGPAGGQGRHRLFEQGDMKLVVLHLLLQGEQHGYDLIKQLQALTGGEYSPSPGVIYPSLTLLEEMDLVVLAGQDGGKKRYAITEAGRAYLQQEAEAVQRILGRLAASATIAQGRQHPQLARAVQNLRTALHLKLAQGPLSESTLQAMAEVLDHAAITLERCE